VFNPDPLAKGIVGFHQYSQFPLWVDHKGQAQFVLGGKLLGKGTKVRLRANVWLGGKNGIAVIIANLLAFGIEPAGIDSSVKAPDVERQREIMPDSGNVIIFGGFLQDRISTGAIRTLQILELIDGHASACRRLQRSGIHDFGGRGGKLCVCQGSNR
jgi:hypothetical protein